MKAAHDDVLGRAVRGDRDALVALLKRHGPSARRALAGKIPKRWQSVLSEEDVLQQTYADAAAKIRHFESPHEHAFAKWLVTVALRNLGDAIKMLGTGKAGGDRWRVEDPPTALLGVITGTPSRVAAGAEAKSALERAVAQLPELYRRVVVMYDLEERTIQEVAEALKRSPGAVYMLRQRAHQRLHETMGRTWNYFSDAS